MTFQFSHSNLLLSDLSYKIIGCAFNVHKVLGGGHLENSYHKAFIAELSKSGLKFISKKQIAINYKEVLVSMYEPDFIVEDSIIIEIKRKGRLTPKDFEQANRYLKATGKKLALLIHFGQELVKVKRVINFHVVN